MNLSEFQHKLSQSPRPVVVDFWAPWCAPCRMTKPLLEKLAQEYAEKVDFLPVNVDDSPQVAQEFKVIGIPSVMAFREGKVLGRVTGAQNEAGYRALFEALLAGKQVKLPLSSFERIFRLGAGALFIVIGISTGYWFVAGMGGLIAFLGVYDRCPLWNALTGMLARK